MRQSPDMERYWMSWTTREKRDPWHDLYEVDRHLRQLPSGTYDHVAHLGTFWGRLYALDIPRHVLWHIYSLLLLRERLCHELGIAMQPLAPDAYGIELPEEEDAQATSANQEDEQPTAEATVPQRPIEELILEVCTGRMESGSDWIAVYKALTGKGCAPNKYAPFARYINAMNLPGLPQCSSETLRKANPIYKRPIYEWKPGNAPEVDADILDRRHEIARALSELLKT